MYSDQIVGVELTEEEENRSGDDGVDADEQIDAHITNERHLCILEYSRQKIHPRECSKAEKKVDVVSYKLQK